MHRCPQSFYGKSSASLRRDLRFDPLTSPGDFRPLNHPLSPLEIVIVLLYHCMTSTYFTNHERHADVSLDQHFQMWITSCQHTASNPYNRFDHVFFTQLLPFQAKSEISSPKQVSEEVTDWESERFPKTWVNCRRPAACRHSMPTEWWCLYHAYATNKLALASDK